MDGYKYSQFLEQNKPTNEFQAGILDYTIRNFRKIKSRKVGDITMISQKDIKDYP